jgi:hypothetical protein
LKRYLCIVPSDGNNGANQSSILFENSIQLALVATCKQFFNENHRRVQFFVAVAAKVAWSVSNR